MTSVWGQRSCVNSCSLSLISRSAVQYFPSGSNEAHEFCVWTWSPFSAQLWPPRPLGSKHKQIRSRSSCKTSVFAWNCLLMKNVPIMQLKSPVEFPKTVYGWVVHSHWLKGFCWRGATFISYSSVRNKRVNLWSGTALSFPFSYKTLQRTNWGCSRGKGCVCLTRWSFFGFLYVLKWLTGGTAEPQRAGQQSATAAFTRIFWFHGSEQEIFWFYKSCGPETSLEISA